jgi:hypothetical protein
MALPTRNMFDYMYNTMVKVHKGIPHIFAVHFIFVLGECGKMSVVLFRGFKQYENDAICRQKLTLMRLIQ